VVTQVSESYDDVSPLSLLDCWTKSNFCSKGTYELVSSALEQVFAVKNMARGAHWEVFELSGIFFEKSCVGSRPFLHRFLLAVPCQRRELTRGLSLTQDVLPSSAGTNEDPSLSNWKVISQCVVLKMRSPCFLNGPAY